MVKIKSEDRLALSNQSLVTVSKVELDTVKEYFDTIIPVMLESLVIESTTKLEEVKAHFNTEVSRLENKLDEIIRGLET